MTPWRRITYPVGTVFRTRYSRRFVQILALTMQLCMAWMSVSALLHDENDDAVCNPVVVLHDHAAHHIGGASKDASPSQDHCFICHNLSLRSLVASVSLDAPVIASQSLAQTAVHAGSSAWVARRPARAPPLA
ncbi:MAG: hypothetical protein U0Q11_20825 [Vicinamibacterales bacterium]